MDKLLATRRAVFVYESARLAAADEIEKWKNAFENLRQYAEDNGLDIMTYNNHKDQSHG